MHRSPKREIEKPESSFLDRIVSPRPSLANPIIAKPFNDLSEIDEITRRLLDSSMDPMSPMGKKKV